MNIQNSLVGKYLIICAILLTGCSGTIEDQAVPYSSTVGNCAMIFVCRDITPPPSFHGKEAKLYEFFQLESRGRSVNIPIDEAHRLDSDVSRAAQSVIDRIKNVDPWRHEYYSHMLETFSARRIDLQGVDLNYDGDANNGELPRPCVKKAVARQETYISLEQPGEAKYFKFDQTYWTMLSSVDQVGAILHEIIYFDALNHNNTDALAAQELNKMLVTSKDEVNPKLYNSILQDFGMHNLHVSVVVPGGVGLSSIWISNEEFETAQEAATYCHAGTEKGSLMNRQVLPDIVDELLKNQGVRRQQAITFNDGKDGLKFWLSIDNQGKDFILAKINPENYRVEDVETPGVFGHAICQGP